MEHSIKQQDASYTAVSDILSRLGRKFEIMHALWNEEKSFEIKFRTEMDKNSIDYNSVCDEWVDKFSDITNTVWAKKISNTGPKVKFRKQYQCWTHKGKIIQKELLFDARKCRGTLDIKVFSDNKTTSKKKNKFYRLGLNVVVKINFYHLHKVNTVEPLSFFVHNCDPQPDAPKQTPIVNERLPHLVADAVRKGLLNSSIQSCIERSSRAIQFSNILPQPNIEKDESHFVNVSIEMPTVLSQERQGNETFLPEELQINTIPPLELVENIPLQNLNDVKLETEQFAQIVVGDSSMNGHLLMCQPLLFDSEQPLPQFVQLNSRSLGNQSQFLQ